MGVTFTAGLMGAGKSKSLIELYEKEETRKMAFAAHLEEKTGILGKIESRNGDSIHAYYLNRNDEEGILTLIRFLFSEDKVDSIFIDEVQFLSEKAISHIVSLAKNFEINVHFYGLLTTFTDDYFEASKYLLKKIDRSKIIHLVMFCEYPECDRLANHNGRIINGNVARDGDTFVEEKSTYMALCSNHYFS